MCTAEGEGTGGKVPPERKNQSKIETAEKRKKTKKLKGRTNREKRRGRGKRKIKAEKRRK